MPMKKIAAAFLSVVALWGVLAVLTETAAQVPQFPQTLPANTVVGRAGIGPGPAQAIPFGVLFSNLFGGGAPPAAHSVLIGEGTSPVNGVLLGDAQILVGQTAADPQAKTMSGDATIADTGALTVAKVNGVTVSGTPANGSLLVGTSATTANWSKTVNGADLYLWNSPTATSQPTWIFNDLTTAGAGWSLQFYGTDTNGGNNALASQINGGYAVRTPGALKGDIDFVVYSGTGAVLAQVALAGQSNPPGWIPSSDNAYSLGTAAARWTTVQAMSVTTQAPVTLTGTSGSTSSTSQIINASGTFTLTLPAITVINTGQWLYIKSIAAQIVNSASSNVVPLGSATAGTAIFPATAGKWASLQCDGTNWIVMAGN
jgi:hypothetical protein